MNALFLISVAASVLLLAQAAVKSPIKQFRDENESIEDKLEKVELAGLKNNVTELWRAVADFRHILADHIAKNPHQQCHDQQTHGQRQSLLGNKNVVTTLVDGVQKPIIGVTETLTSDYFPFPEDSHRPNEHYPNQYPGSASHTAHHNQDTSFGQGPQHHQQPHHQNQAARSGCDFKHQSAFMRPPRIRYPENFDLAVCHVRPNSALSVQERGNVHGLIFLKQKKDSKSMLMSVRLSGFNVSHHDASEHHEEGHGKGHEQSERIKQHEEVEPIHTQTVEKFVQQTVKVGNLGQGAVDDSTWAVGPLHGIHVHEFADLSGGCDSTGGHYNPYRLRHGGPNNRIRHVGDFGNIDSDSEGVTNLLMMDEVASLRGQYSIIGKPLVIHADGDDYGLGGNQGSSTTGNSGKRLACCIIERVASDHYNDASWAKASDSHHKDHEAVRKA